MCICKCIFPCTYTHIFLYVYIHSHVCIFTCVCVHVYSHVRIYIFTRMYTYILIHSHVCIWSHGYSAWLIHVHSGCIIYATYLWRISSQIPHVCGSWLMSCHRCMWFVTHVMSHIYIVTYVMSDTAQETPLEFMYMVRDTCHVHMSGVHDACQITRRRCLFHLWMWFVTHVMSHM